MRCPYCHVMDDKVVDSRVAEAGGAIRRRRECLGCGRRYTTFERVEEVHLVVVKRSGAREPFDRGKIVDGIRRAAKNRPIADADIDALAAAVEEQMRELGPEVGTDVVGKAVLDSLRTLDLGAGPVVDVGWNDALTVTALVRPNAQESSLYKMGIDGRNPSQLVTSARLPDAPTAVAAGPNLPMLTVAAGAVFRSPGISEPWTRVSKDSRDSAPAYPG